MYTYITDLKTAWFGRRKGLVGKLGWNCRMNQNNHLVSLALQRHWLYTALALAQQMHWSPPYAILLQYPLFLELYEWFLPLLIGTSRTHKAPPPSISSIQPKPNFHQTPSLFTYIYPDINSYACVYIVNNILTNRSPELKKVFSDLDMKTSNKAANWLTVIVTKLAMMKNRYLWLVTMSCFLILTCSSNITVESDSHPSKSLWNPSKRRIWSSQVNRNRTQTSKNTPVR